MGKEQMPEPVAAPRAGWSMSTGGCIPTRPTGATSASIYKGQWFSDHAPLTVDYDVQI
jgi:exodeoxyribonuclease-3